MNSFTCWAGWDYYRLEGQDCPLDNFNALPDLILFDDEGWSQSDDVTVSGLGQQAIVTETKAHSPCIIIWKRNNDMRGMLRVQQSNWTWLLKALCVFFQVVNEVKWYFFFIYNYYLHWLSCAPPSWNYRGQPRKYSFALCIFTQEKTCCDLEKIGHKLKGSSQLRRNDLFCQYTLSNVNKKM